MSTWGRFFVFIFLAELLIRITVEQRDFVKAGKPLYKGEMYL
jgi:hypothetical protein